MVKIYTSSYSSLIKLKNKHKFDVIYIGIEYKTPPLCKPYFALVPSYYKIRKVNGYSDDIRVIQEEYKSQLKSINFEQIFKILSSVCRTSNWLFVSEDEEDIYRFLLKNWFNYNLKKCLKA